MPASAIKQEQTVAPSITDWSRTATFAGFDPSAGLLQGLNIGLVGTIAGDISLENLDAAPAVVTVSLPGVISVLTPNGGPLATVAPDPTASASLAAFDGAADFAGASGTVLAGVSQSLSTALSLVPASVGIDGFAGSAEVALPVTASARLHLTGPANLGLVAHTSAAADITLDYTYTPTPPADDGSLSEAPVFGVPLGDGGPPMVTTTPQSFDFADKTTGWTDSVAANRFDPTLGRLVSVNLTLTDDILASSAAENLGPAAASYSSTQAATVTLHLPGPVPTESVSATANDTASLAAYDGTTDFTGPSGHIDQGITQTATSSATLTGSDLAGFVGSGTTGLAVDSSDTATIDGPGNLAARLTALGGASVSLNYTYQPAPYISGAGGTLNYAAGQAPAAIDPTLALGDAYATTLTGATVVISNAAAGDVLAADTGETGITASYDPTNAVLTLTGNASLAVYQQVLRSVTFASIAADPSKGGTDTSRTVGWTVTDGPGGVSAEANSTIIVPAMPDEWINSAGGSWFGGSNWTSDPASPGAGQDVAITGDGGYTIDVISPVSVRSLVLDAPGAVLRLDAALNVAAGFTLEAGTVLFSGGSLAVGSYTQEGGVASGSTVDIAASGAFDVNAGVITGDNIVLSGGTIGATGTIDAAGTLDLVATVGMIAGTGPLVAGTLIGSSGLGVNLTGANQIAAIGSLTATQLTLNDNLALTIAGTTVPAGSIVSTGGVSIGAVGAVTPISLIPMGGTLVIAPAPITESAAAVASTIDTLRTRASQGLLGGITLSDAITPTISISAAMFAADSDVLRFIQSSFGVAVPAVLRVEATPLQQLTLGGDGDLDRVSFQDGMMVYDPNDPAAAIFRLYQSALGRDPDPSGLAWWTARMAQGMSLHDVAQGMVGSIEFQSRFPAATRDAASFVTQLYANVLHRTPDQGGLNYWVAELNGGQQDQAQVVVGFAESDENRGATASTISAGIWVPNENAAAVARLYYSALGRAPDAGGLAYWTSLLGNGAESLAEEASQFMASPEFLDRYGNLSTNDFVNVLYQNVLGRNSDSAGLTWWTGQLNSGAQTRAGVVVGFSESAEHQAEMSAVVDQRGIVTIS